MVSYVLCHSVPCGPYSILGLPCIVYGVFLMVAWLHPHVYAHGAKKNVSRSDVLTSFPCTGSLVLH